MTDGHARRPPLAGHYAPTAAVALLALCPNIVLTTAIPLAQKGLETTLHTSLLGVQTAEALSNAGYALGAVIAAFLVQRFRQRVLFIVTEAVFVAGSVLAATAAVAPSYVVGRAVQGTTTGLMLVIALPPWVTRYGARRLPRTGALVNIGLFGAVTAGPLLGGLAGSEPEAWRWLFATVAAAGVAGVVCAAFTLPYDPPFDPAVPPDWSAFTLAAAATVLPFFGVSRLSANPVTAPISWAPVLIGVIALLALVTRQYRRPDALMPVRALSTSLPVVGTLAAMIAGAAVVTLTTLTVTSFVEVQHESVALTGLLLTPQVAGVAIAAFLFARLMLTRWLPALVLAGMLLTAGAGALLLFPARHLFVLAAAGLLGLGAGTTVSPGLFLAAFGVESSKIGRAFALVELLRAEAAYLVAPVLLYAARQDGDLSGGLRLSTWIVIATVGVAVVILVALYRASGVHPHPPDVEAWLDAKRQALHSPPTAASARRRLSATGTRAR